MKPISNGAEPTRCGGTMGSGAERGRAGMADGGDEVGCADSSRLTDSAAATRAEGRRPRARGGRRAAEAARARRPPLAGRPPRVGAGPPLVGPGTPPEVLEVLRRDQGCPPPTNSPDAPSLAGGTDPRGRWCADQTEIHRCCQVQKIQKNVQIFCMILARKKDGIRSTSRAATRGICACRCGAQHVTAAARSSLWVIHPRAIAARPSG